MISKDEVIEKIQNRLNFYRKSIEYAVKAKNYAMANEYQAKVEACEMIFHNIMVEL